VSVADDGLGPTGGVRAQLPDPEATSPIGRRVVLGMAGLGLGGILVGSKLQHIVQDVMTPIQTVDPTGLSQLVPAAGGFRIYTITNSLPGRSAAEWSLTVGGLVDKPLTITYDELVAMPATELVKDFQCVTGWRVPKVHWKGVQLAHILELAGVQPAGKALAFHSFDNADTESLTLDQARRPDVIVAYEMLGAPVTREHGGPVRLYVAPMYGYKSLKWLDGIKVTSDVEPGYWEQNGYDVDGWVGKSNGRDDTPT
jgi:DMSO/TMAO reductase YedYZ molybdopterin-dependent catalytic subunit